MRRILFIGNFLSKSTGTKGAVEKLSYTLDKINIYPILISRYHNKFIRLFDMVFSCLIRKYEKIHIDIYSGNALYFAIVCIYISNFRKKKAIINLRGGMLPEKFRDRPNKLKLLFKKADRIITPSLYLKEYFTDLGFQVGCVPNSIELGKFPYKRNENKTLSILWVRAFLHTYSPEIAVYTLKEVVKYFPEAKLTMVGPDKGELSKIQKLSEALNLNGNIIFLGSIENDELHKYYNSHHVFINTPKYESFGVCIAEAASCGIPIISNNVGEVKYLWENRVDVLLVENNDPLEFAKGIMEIYKNKTLSDSLSSNARKKVQQFDLKNILPIWENLLLNE